MAASYADKLKDPRWQKKRLEIMERDGWQCQCCMSRKKPLTVHHRFYLEGVDPWAYTDRCYVTLCEDCHNEFHRVYEDMPNEKYVCRKNEPNGNKQITLTDAFLFKSYVDSVIKQQGYNGFRGLAQAAITSFIKEEEL